jgi:hypothetical protein
MLETEIEMRGFSGQKKNSILQHRPYRRRGVLELPGFDRLRDNLGFSCRVFHDGNHPVGTRLFWHRDVCLPQRALYV